MTFRGRPSSRRHKRTLNAMQELAYASETEENFRWLSSLLATKSKYVLTSVDLVDTMTYTHISEIGQYAEIAHGSVSPSFIFQNLDELCQPGYPLSSYDALKNDGACLVDQFIGTVAGVQGYVAFRPNTRQLVVAFSGTSSLAQTLKDIQTWKTAYPLDEKNSTVHAGFWQMYQGVRDYAIEALRMGFQRHEGSVDNVVLTGHSMGCTMCYLLALNIMVEAVDGVDSFLPRGSKVNITVFGSPRLGNEGLARYWRRSVDTYRSLFGNASFWEYSVKGYNDGAHTLPPYNLGFHHLTLSPLYLYSGRLYHIPSSECEHGAFVVDDLASVDARSQTADIASMSPGAGSALKALDISWPKGGHNYYIRDMEKLQRQMRWLGLNLHGETGWQERYKAKAKAWEIKWGKESDNPLS
ncbi:alpha/beta-hydrolase [Ramaria rubella]|nr:alpha/beta-hydrolase [Ramaria rubella]